MYKNEKSKQRRFGGGEPIQDARTLIASGWQKESEKDSFKHMKVERTIEKFVLKQLVKDKPKLNSVMS